MDEMNLENSFVMDMAKELVTVASSIVVKREDIAQRYETLDTLKAYDQYSQAIIGADTFESYEKFDIDIMEQAGLTELEIANALLSKRNIPESKREAVVELQRQRVIENFVEMNNYYRMLNGLPFTDDYLAIFIQEPVEGVDTNKPIHEMTDDEIFILESLGYITQLKERYPDRAYLKYLGTNKIPIVTAREAKRFDILRMNTSINQDLLNRFNVNYVRSKTYILNNYYKRRFSLDHTYFDAYIGFLIVVNAMIMTINDSITMFNNKEYSNELTIKHFLQSHNLDIFDDIPYVYRKQIADNLKSLIVSKGTDEVIGKIFKIFGFDDVVVRKFILVKEHLKDANGDYIFSYEDDGVTPKYDEMYNVYFSQVDINSTNIDTEIRRPENRLTYLEVTANDIFWGGYEDDETVRQKLLREEFNYIDTDYININTAYDLTTLGFELSYFLSMTLSVKSSIENMVLTEPFRGQQISLFYAITMLSALLSKKFGFNGDIITDPVDIAVVNRFNFERSVSVINGIMAKYNYTSSQNFATILPPAVIPNTAELVDLYFRNKRIIDNLIEIKTNTRNLNEYLACKEILEYISQSKMSANIYRKSDNTIAETYLDYLYSKNQLVAMFIDELEPELIDTTIFRLITSLEEFIQSDRFKYVFLKIPTLSSENILKTYMLKLINTFKAFTINIFSMTVTYDINNTSENIKLLDGYTFEGNIFSHDGILITDSLGASSVINGTSMFKFRDELEIIQTNVQGGL